MCGITDRRAVRHRYLICGRGQLSETKDEPRIIKESPALHRELQQTPVFSTDTLKSALLSPRVLSVLPGYFMMCNPVHH